MDKYVPPVRPGETYSQGFWHAIIAATLYSMHILRAPLSMLEEALTLKPTSDWLNDSDGQYAWIFPWALPPAFRPR
jgi:hypothetical protein